MTWELVEINQEIANLRRESDPLDRSASLLLLACIYNNSERNGPEYLV